MVEPSKKTTASKSLQTVKEVRGFLRTLYQGGHEARKRGEKVAWVMVGTNIPILRAMNVYPIFPENYTAFCAAKHVQEQTGVPSLYLESDIIDIRDFSEGQTKTQIESFIKILETRKLMTGG